MSLVHRLATFARRTMSRPRRGGIAPRLAIGGRRLIGRPYQVAAHTAGWPLISPRIDTASPRTTEVRPLLRTFAIVAMLCAAACARAPVPDLVIVNARVFTNDTARPWAEAVAVRGDRVIGVGASAEIRATAGPDTRVIDAGGRVLVPGFNDARVDLPLEPPTPATLAALDRAAITHGVTSLQVIAGGPMRSLVAAAQQAERQARWRLVRSPMDGERPQDEEPFLPPQPGVRLVANGVAWAMSHPHYQQNGLRMPWPGRGELEPDRLATVVGWAYGAEDPLILAIDDAAEAAVAAMTSTGVAEVWKRKRPRLDVRDEPAASDEGLTRLVHLGVVVTYIAAPTVETTEGQLVTHADMEDSSLLVRLRRAGVPVALGSGRSRSLFAALAAGEQWKPGAPERRQVAIEAATRGSAYAEKAERDKGWLGSGTLADLAVLSDDVFTVPAERLAAITSVLTLVGGTVVYDPGVVSR